MPIQDRDKGHLWDMLAAGREIRGFVEGVSLHSYVGDRKLQLAIERLLEIVGEAARRTSPECRAECPHIQWAQIVGLRNVLIHEYGEIRNDIIWRVATVRIPELVTSLENLNIE